MVFRNWCDARVAVGPLEEPGSANVVTDIAHKLAGKLVLFSVAVGTVILSNEQPLRSGYSRTSSKHT